LRSLQQSAREKILPRISKGTAMTVQRTRYTPSNAPTTVPIANNTPNATHQDVPSLGALADRGVSCVGSDGFRWIASFLSIFCFLPFVANQHGMRLKRAKPVTLSFPRAAFLKGCRQGVSRWILQGISHEQTYGFGAVRSHDPMEDGEGHRRSPMSRGTISPQELHKILDQHKLWLTGPAKGRQANLSGADLGGVDLSAGRSFMES